VHRAEGISELAELAGIDPTGLADSVQRYNGAVTAGADGEFGRRHLPAPIERAPFYAVRNHALTLITFTGVDVDAELRVRCADGTVIAGLYAAGEVLGAGATSGNSFCGGMLITPALAFGRLLGQRLGDHLAAQAHGEPGEDLLARPSEQPPAREVW
jgi:succinate dehydrogenase/fumarate reductase flavoprotein subunit